MLHLKNNIKYIRELANKTQYDFAKMFDIKNKKDEFSEDKIYTFENGRAKPPQFFLESLANYAGITVSELKDKKLSKEDIKFNKESDIIAKTDNGLFIAEVKTNDKADNSNAELIQALNKQIALLEKINEGLEKRLISLEANYKRLEGNQGFLIRQLSVAFHLSIEQLVGDRKKRESVLNEFDKLIFSEDRQM